MYLLQFQHYKRKVDTLKFQETTNTILLLQIIHFAKYITFIETV
jgi:hypothetical protein